MRPAAREVRPGARIGVKPRTPNREPQLRGFSLIELLLVVALIGILVALVTVAASRVRGTAERTRTEQLLTSIEMALGQFREDHGFYPPLLDDRTEQFYSADVGVVSPAAAQNVAYFSTLTLVPYLIGVGDLVGNRNLLNSPYNDGHAGPGFRGPGPDRSWGHAHPQGRQGYWESKEVRGLSGEDYIPGEVYGPYLELGSDDLLGVAFSRPGGGQPDRNLPLDNDVVGERRMFVILDYWGEPIRYYRHWPDASRWSQNNFPTPEWLASLPAEQRSDPQGLLNSSFVTQLRSAEYVLLSNGPDGAATVGRATNFENAVRNPQRDQNNPNRDYHSNLDNIVRVGP